MDIETVRGIASDAAKAHGLECRANLMRTGVVHVEMAGPLNRGDGFGVCCHNQSDTGYGWEWIQQGEYQNGTYGAQCGGCGSQSAGWAGDSVTVGGVRRDRLVKACDKLATGLAAWIAAFHDARNAATLAQLRAQLAGIMALSADTQDEAIEFIGGSEYHPGVYRDVDGVIVAWDYDARFYGSSECIEVTSTDMATK